jgi:ABC-2 type transport system permease protein
MKRLDPDPAAPAVPWHLLSRSRQAVKKYWNIVRASLIERLTYRSDFLLGTILRFLPMITTILLWEAIFAGAQQDRLSDYTLHEMIAYLLLVHISRMFSSMPGLANSIARDIREGTLKKYLIQPLDMIGYLLSYRAAHKAAYIATSALPYALLFFVCRDYFDSFPDPLTLLAYLVSLVLGFFIGFFFEAAIGMVGFWLLEVTSLLYIVNVLNFFVSGQMFPLDLLAPEWGFWARLLKMMPFQYMAYFPAAVFLGKIRGAELVNGLIGEVIWVLVFIILARVFFRIGLRRYSAYGG